MRLIITFICIILSIRIIRKNDVGLLILSMFVASPAIIVLSVPFEVQFKRWLIITLLICFWGQKLTRKRADKTKFPLNLSVFIMFLGSVALILFDSRFSILYRFLYPILDALDIYLVLIFAFYFSSRFDFSYIYKYFVASAILIVIYGLFNYVTGTNPVADLVDSIYGSTDGYTVDSGSRRYVRSFSRYVFDFGYNCSVLLLCFLYKFMKSKNMRTIELIALILSFIGVVICGSRTILVTSVLSILVLMLISLNTTKLIKYILIAGCGVFAAYLIVPPITDMVDMTISTIFQQSGDVTGSSVDMRMTQLTGAVSLWAQEPIWGNGYKYIFNELSLSENVYTTEMAGYESIIFNLLIERGLVGIIVYIIFFSSLLIYFFRNRNYNYAHLGSSFIVIFLATAIGTGTLDSWCNTMILCGFIISSIERQKNLDYCNMP